MNTSQAATSAPAHRAPRSYDANGECVGCGASFGQPCQRHCPYRTGRFDTATVLRLAGARLDNHRNTGIGFDVWGALYTAARALFGPSEARDRAIDAQHLLAAHLATRRGVSLEPSVAMAVSRYALFADTEEMTSALYGAALPPGQASDIRVGHRITIHGGRGARGARGELLMRTFAIDVTYVRPAPGAAGRVDVDGLLLTQDGRYRKDCPTRGAEIGGDAGGEWSALRTAPAELASRLWPAGPINFP